MRDFERPVTHTKDCAVIGRAARFFGARAGLALCAWLLVLLPGAGQAECRHLPPLVPDRVGRAQIFVYGLKDRNILRGRRDIVWADAGEKIPGIYAMSYMEMDRDPEHSHDVAWYRTYHPDWLVYKCDRVSPAHEFRYEYGYDTPVDVTNPAVREYLYSVNRDMAKVDGRFEAAGIDNVTSKNLWSRCGVWHRGQWMQKYSGARIDPAYARDIAAWMKWLGDRTHEAGDCLAANHYFDGSDAEGYKEVAAQLDIIVDEHGFTRKCHPTVTDQTWLERITLFRDIARTKPVVIIDQVCPTAERITRGVLDWSLANYLLLKGDRSYLAIVSEDHYGPGFQDFPDLYLETGKPLGDFTAEAGAYARRFERALALVNPSSTATASYDLGDKEWADLDGQRYRGFLELPPGSAHVLVPAGS